MRIHWESNKNKDIDGFIVQLPLPKHIDEQKVTTAILPKKDVDGVASIVEQQFKLEEQLLNAFADPKATLDAQLKNTGTNRRRCKHSHCISWIITATQRFLCVLVFTKTVQKLIGGFYVAACRPD